MIDLSARGLSVLQTSHQGGKREKAGAAPDHGKDAKNFGDLVNAAAKKTGNKIDAGDTDQVETGDTDRVEARAKADAADSETPRAGPVRTAQTVRAVETQLNPGGKKASETEPKNETGWTRDTAHSSDDDVIDALDPDAETLEPKAATRAAPVRSNADAPIRADVGQDSKAAHKADAKHSIDAKTVATSDDKQDNSAESAKPIDLQTLTSGTVKTEAPVTDGRVRLSAGLQQFMKPGADNGALRQAGSDKPEVNADKADTKKAQTPRNDATATIDSKKGASPAEELNALLSLPPDGENTDENPVGKAGQKTSAKASRHDGDDDRVADAKGMIPEHGVESATLQPATIQQAAAKTLVETPVRADVDDDNEALSNETDKIRVVSSDGKSQAVDIELPKKRGDDGAAPANSGKTDFVTVLDSRRYLGFSSDSNSVALTNAIKAEPSWAQVIQGVNNGSHRTATEVNTLKLQMSPEHLGNMTASLRLKGDELSVEVRVESVEAYRQLSTDQDGIVRALKDQGFSIDQVTIQLSPSAKADGGQASSQNNSNQSAGNGQNLQEGGQGDNSRQRDESTRRNTNQNNWAGNDRTSSFSDPGNGSDDPNARNLYL